MVNLFDSGFMLILYYVKTGFKVNFVHRKIINDHETTFVFYTFVFIFYNKCH